MSQDFNRDGLETGDDGALEGGIRGARVELQDPHGNVVQVAYTNANGEYQFDVPAGEYRVHFQDFPNRDFTEQDVGNDDRIDSDVNAEGLTDLIYVGAGQAVRDVDAAIVESPGWITGRLTIDDDRDDTEVNTVLDDTTDALDTGVAGEPVRLLDLDGNVVAETSTDHAGNYQFDVAPGDYRVQFPNGDNQQFADQNVGSEATDSDADANGLTDVIRVYPGQTVSDVDASLQFEHAAIEGRLFNDLDHDGLEDGSYDQDSFYASDELTTHSGQLTTDGVPGGMTAVDFAGGYQHGATLPSTTIGGDMTLSAWARFDDPQGGNYQRVFDLSNGAGQDNILLSQIRGTNHMLFEVYHEGAPNTHIEIRNAIEHGEWAHWSVTATQDGTYRVYKDGEEVGSATDQPPIAEIERSTTLVGDSPWGHDTTLNGAVAGMLVEDRVLTPEEIADLYAHPGAGEPGEEGATVALLNPDGSAVLDDAGNPVTTTTDADGNYRFDYVQPGDYRVEFTAPEGQEFTLQNVGDDDRIDSDVNGAGVSDVISVAPGETVSDVDAGIQAAPPEQAAIEGRLFNDLNHDGLDQGDYIDLADLTLNSGTLISEGVPGGLTAVEYDGGYEAGASLPSTTIGGDTTISAWARFDHTGGNYQRVFDLSNGAAQDNILLSQEAGTDNIWFEVYHDGAPNTLIRVEDAIEEGEWAHWAVSASSDGTYRLYKDGEEIGSATGQPPIAEIERSTTLVGDSPWNHDTTLDGAVAGMTVSDRVLTPEEIADLYAHPGAGEPGEEGATVALLNPDGTPVLDDAGNPVTTTTDTDGNYRFDVDPGDYRVAFTAPEGQEFTLQNVGDDDRIDSDVNDAGVSDLVSVGEGETVTDVDAGIQDATDPEPEPPTGEGTGKIGGFVFYDMNGNGLNDQEGGIDAVNVSLFLADGSRVASTVTDDEGSYRFDNVAAGEYFVTFDEGDQDLDGRVLTIMDAGDNQNDEIDSDANQHTGQTDVFTLEAGQTLLNIDAGAVDPETSSISGRFFVDENNNAIDDDDSVLEGMKVFLVDDQWRDIAVTETDENGEYSFTGLEAGLYSLRFEEITEDGGFVEPNDPNGLGDDTNDSDVNGFGQTEQIYLGIDQQITDIDAGAEPFFYDEDPNYVPDYAADTADAEYYEILMREDDQEDEDEEDDEDQDGPIPIYG